MRTTTFPPLGSRRTVRKGGFSLIEILIAMLILSIAIIALADLFLYSIRKNATSSQLTRANQLAQDKLEELFAVDFANLAVSNPTDCEFDWDGNDVPIDVPNCWTNASPCPANGTDVVRSMVGKNLEPGGTTVDVVQWFDRCWWVLQGPQGFTGRDQTRILRVVVRPRMADPTRGYIGKAVLADMSAIKAGQVGGAFSRN